MSAIRPACSLRAVGIAAIGLSASIGIPEVWATPALERQSTSLGSCLESEASASHATRELECDRIGRWQVTVIDQSPNLFEVALTDGSRTLHTDLATLANDLPVQAGAHLHWWLDAGQPRLLLLELAWGTAQQPWDQVPHQVLLLVGADRICPLAIISPGPQMEKQIDQALATAMDGPQACPAHPGQL